MNTKFLIPPIQFILLCLIHRCLDDVANVSVDSEDCNSTGGHI